jgi:hypothetical protein
MLGVANSAKASHSETKLISVGNRSKLGLGLIQQYELGAWADRAGYGRKSSAYTAYQVGVEAGESFIGRFMAGPALISTPDSYLGGYFQFSEDLFFGIKGENGNTIGVIYKHFSSAGLETPNVGRDFLGISISIPLFGGP